MHLLPESGLFRRSAQSQVSGQRAPGRDRHRGWARARSPRAERTRPGLGRKSHCGCEELENASGDGPEWQTGEMPRQYRSCFPPALVPGCCNKPTLIFKNGQPFLERCLLTTRSWLASKKFFAVSEVSVEARPCAIHFAGRSLRFLRREIPCFNAFARISGKLLLRCASFRHQPTVRLSTHCSGAARQDPIELTAFRY